MGNTSIQTIGERLLEVREKLIKGTIKIIDGQTKIARAMEVYVEKYGKNTK